MRNTRLRRYPDGHFRGAEVAAGDVTDAAGLRAALEGCSAVVRGRCASKEKKTPGYSSLLTPVF